MLFSSGFERDCGVCRCSQSVVYSEVTMEEAQRRVKSMSADMGGTEILQPLKHIYTQPCYPDHPRQVQPNILII